VTKRMVRRSFIVFLPSVSTASCGLCTQDPKGLKDH
jgi:hypothetical protein